MTLRKKGSRTIVVDNIRYRWLISPNRDFVIAIVQQEDCNGQKIEVHIATDIDSFWVEFPQTNHLNLKVVTPADLETVIR